MGPESGEENHEGMVYFATRQTGQNATMRPAG
jgi:hypothetical protein